MDVSNQDSQLMVTQHYSSTFFQVGFPIFVTNIIWQNDVGFKISCIKNIFEITSNLWCSYHTLLSKCCFSETLRLNNLKMKRFSLVFMFCTFCVNSKKRHFNEASIHIEVQKQPKIDRFTVAFHVLVRKLIDFRTVQCYMWINLKVIFARSF